MIDLSRLEQQFSLPTGLLSAVMQQESGGNPNAVSPKGALGSFQFMPATAQQYGIDPTDPEQSAVGAARMYSDLLGKYNGDVPSALAAYNWGQGNVDRQGLSNAPAETQNYISKIMGSIGNAIVPSAQAAPADLSQLSDEQLQQIAGGGGQQPSSDLSHLSDEQLVAIASSQQPTGNTKSNGETNSPNDFYIGDNQQNSSSGNSALSKLESLVSEAPDDNYFGLIPMAKSLGRGILGMMKDVAGEGQPVGSNLNMDELGALMAISPTTRAILPTSGGTLKSITKDTFVGDVIDNIATRAPKSDLPVVAKTTVPALIAKAEGTTSQDFHVLAQKSYALADESGGVLTPKFTDKFIEEAKSVAPQTEAGKIISGDSTATQLVERMQALKGKPINLSGAQEIDEALGSLIDKEFGIKGLSKEGKGIYDLQTKFRSMMNDAVKDGDVAGGAQGFEAWKQGQQYWAQSMAMRDVEKMMKRAELTDNPSTSLRTQMRNLYTNDARMRGFKTKAEKKAILNASKTGAVTGLLKMFGSRLIPYTAGIAEGISGGGVTGGILTATVAHGLTSASRNAATKLQMNRAQKVLDTIAKRPAKGK